VSPRTPYEHLWDFLAENDGYYLSAVKNRLHDNSNTVIGTSAIARIAQAHMSAKEITIKN
jgi:hypothetical protein